MRSINEEAFGEAVWGGKSSPALRAPTMAKSQETVLNALLQNPWSEGHQKRLDWTVSLMIHIVIVAALLILPMCFTQAIDMSGFQAMVLIAPAPPAPASPPAQIVRNLVVRRPIIPAKLVAPVVIPRRIALVREPEVPPEVAGVTGGNSGGPTYGILDKVIGETGNIPAISPPVREKKKNEIVRVGGVVKPARQIYAPRPEYPALAQMADVQGTVLIEATIDEHGNVIDVRAAGGPPLLIPEALSTVMTWKYEPTYLNGVPTSVRMEVKLHFSLK